MAAQHRISHAIQTQLYEEHTDKQVEDKDMCIPRWVAVHDSSWREWLATSRREREDVEKEQQNVQQSAVGLGLSKGRAHTIG